MAKRKLNKSDEVRKIIAEQPALPAPQVVEMLRARKISITTGLVYALKKKAKSTKPGRKPGRKAKMMRIPKMTFHANGSGLTLQDISAIKDLTGKLGKADLKTAIDLIG